MNSSGAYAACFQHDAVVPVFACGADEYDELAKTKKTIASRISENPRTTDVRASMTSLRCVAMSAPGACSRYSTTPVDIKSSSDSRPT